MLYARAKVAEITFSLEITGERNTEMKQRDRLEFKVGLGHLTWMLMAKR